MYLKKHYAPKINNFSRLRFKIVSHKYKLNSALEVINDFIFSTFKISSFFSNYLLSFLTLNLILV